MCMHYMRVKSVNVHAAKASFVPCGKCYECRMMERSSWEFRFRAEVEEFVVNQGWQMGFITLTYNDQQLPHLPAHAFRDYDSFMCNSDYYRSVPCFDKSHVRKLVHGLRKYLNKKYGVKRLVYLVCSEFGENTQRPHYHASFLFPPQVPAEEFYQCIRDLWTGEEGYIEQPRIMCGSQRVLSAENMRPNLGFVCPREFGGFGREKPFLVDRSQAIATAKYVAKYVTKDIAYMEQLPYDVLDVSRKKIDSRENETDEYVFEQLPLVRDYLPFHMQTRSLGLGCLLQRSDDGSVTMKSDDELLRLYLYGLQFTGDKSAHLQPLPLYIKNKIVFTPYYIMSDDGRRLVRRQASEFFNIHYREVYRKKLDTYAEIFNKVFDRDYYLSCAVSDRKADEWIKVAYSVIPQGSGITPYSLAEHYLLYFGVPCNRCHVLDDKALIYINHYYPQDGLLKEHLPSRVSKLHRFGYGFLEEQYKLAMDARCSILLGILQFTTKLRETDEERLLMAVADYHKHLDDHNFEECGYISSYTDKKELEYGF